MLQSQERDLRIEFVAEQLQRVQWINGSSFKEGEGYLLDWSPQGGHRMLLLQIALQNSSNSVHGLDRMETPDAETATAIRDFWEACLAQLSLTGKDDEVPTLVKIIESWKPRH